MQKFHLEEEMQRKHFNAIASMYKAHYGDTWSEQYRYKFINEPMFENISLSGAKVIDALCGNGETTAYLLNKCAHITGIDISQNEIMNFQKRFPDCTGLCSSILATDLPSNSYDCVVVVGGLHHLQPHVSDAVNEIHRILKPGGHFCFMEPHKGSLPDLVRQLWYRSDSLFLENEAAIDLAMLKTEFSSKFQVVKEIYKGNLAYLFVLNSMIFRIPLKAKAIYSPFLLVIESIFEKVQSKLFSCFVICHWKKI